MLTPNEIMHQLTVNELIGLVQTLGTKEFDIVLVERDEQLDPMVYVVMRKTLEEKIVGVKPLWPISA